MDMWPNPKSSTTMCLETLIIKTSNILVTSRVILLWPTRGCIASTMKVALTACGKCRLVLIHISIRRRVPGVFSNFTAQVALPGGCYSNLFTYAAHMYDADTARSDKLTGFVMFDCSGAVKMEITYNGGPLKSAQIWPQGYGITPTINSNVITFTIPEPKNIVLEVNSNIFEALSIFANPMETNVPSATDKNVMFFGSGLHEYGNYSRIERLTLGTYAGRNTCTEDVFYVPSGTTLYVQGGAVVKAQIRTNPYWNGGGTTTTKTNITIIGRGVVDCSQWCGEFTDADKYHEPEMPGIVAFSAQ